VPPDEAAPMLPDGMVTLTGQVAEDLLRHLETEYEQITRRVRLSERC
jgi:hypothetical protein